MTSPSLHALLVLSDTALPLGSFAFSSGLESFLAHNQHNKIHSSAKLQAFDGFLEHSLSNLASTALPYVLTAYRDPSQLDGLDNDFDASTPCTVARRASISQGRALLTIWSRALSTSVVSGREVWGDAISTFAASLKASKLGSTGLQANAHFPPLFGAVCAAMGLSEDDTAYLFLMNHAKALLSAAVRASVMGPYQSQSLLASANLQVQIKRLGEQYRHVRADDAMVTAPVMDLWMGRHELLYSRIFNS